MAYTPINWQTGDTITAEKLNKMDNGWGYESTQLFSETVTTVAGEHGNEAQLAYSQIISDDKIVVTFDGTDYVCQNRDMSTPSRNFFGGVDSSVNYDFSTYPFAISSVLGSSNIFNIVATETAGTHTIAVLSPVLDTSADFSAAVAAASPIDASTLPLRCVEGVTTHDEAVSAMNNGRLVYFTANDETYAATPKCFMVNTVSRTCTIVPTSTKIAAGFGTDSGLFYIRRLSS